MSNIQTGFTNQVVMVTGATGNLGRATVQAFADAGARIVAVDRNPDKQAQMHPALAQSQRHWLAAPVDLTSPEETQAVVEQAVARMGRIDVLVNTVGGFRAGKPAQDTAVDVWDLMMELNAKTAFLMCRAVAPHMQERKRGKIVNVAARAGLAGTAKMSAYSASKSAVIRLTETLAAELRRQGVNANCILPGTIDTPENREAMPDADFSRWVTPESLAEVILFLASDAARDVHGAALPVYGRS
ncbi:MAG: SDR family NAD(P)-dependent oxidoreductase [Chloroflexota bacterium]|nr:SDR family NAD(P)-dependent oxidoreductase [Chloroflexota bacterium]